MKAVGLGNEIGTSANNVGPPRVILQRGKEPKVLKLEQDQNPSNVTENASIVDAQAGNKSQRGGKKRRKKKGTVKAEVVPLPANTENQDTSKKKKKKRKARKNSNNEGDPTDSTNSAVSSITKSL